jgi:NAD(P)H-quinone oxidoreductase subunit K
LRKKIANQSIQELPQLQQSHRYYSITHKMKVVPPINDGKYLKSPTREAPSKEITKATGLPLPLALQQQKIETNR